MPSRRRRPALRRHFVNDRYPLVILRFEDGHEIRIARGEGRSFTAYPGERIHVIAVYDLTSDERVVLETRLGEEFSGTPPAL